MIANKEDERKSQDLGLDMEAFEMRVDQEIDNLFVPGNVVDDGEEDASGVQLVDDVEIQVVGDLTPETSTVTGSVEGKVESAPKRIDMGTFELQIEKEIDSLFVPADMGEAPVGPSSFGAAGQEHEVLGALQVDADAARSSTDLPEPPPLRLELESPEDEAGVYAPPRISPTPEKAPEPILAKEALTVPTTREEAAESAHDGELAHLVENFNIAYLSLDWEFSSENLTKLWSALEGLQGYCGKSRETLFLFKLVRSLLHRLRTQPDSVQPEIIEMMRDGHEVLKTLLVAGGAPGAGEKEKLKSLVGRYKLLRDGAGGKAEEVRPETTRVEAVSPFLALSNVPGTDWTSMTRDEFPHWMESHTRMAANLDNVLAGEAAAILRLDETESKKLSLGDVSSRLIRIRSVLEEYAAISREREQEWVRGLEWLLQYNGHGDMTEDQPEREVMPESVPTPADEPVPGAASGTVDGFGEPREEQVFFFTRGGKKFGILSKHVVKIDSVKTKKVEKIITRGHATLADFKPFLRSLKTGLLGAWSGLPAEILKTYRFIPMSLEMPGMDEASSPAGGAVLVGSGRNHGVIFVDSGAVDLHNATAVKFKRDKEDIILGLAQDELESSIDVLNMDALLRRPRQESEPGGGQ